VESSVSKVGLEIRERVIRGNKRVALKEDRLAEISESSQGLIDGLIEL